MPTDGPADPDPAGRTSAEAEGSIVDRLRSPVRNSGESRGQLADGTAAADADAEPEDLTDRGYVAAGGGPHDPVDSSRANPGLLEASRAAAGIAPASAGTRAVDVQPARVQDRDPRKEKRAERQVALLFTLTVVAVLGFLVAFIVGDPNTQYYTPVLGIAMALALYGVGAAAIVWAKKLMPDEEAVQEREPLMPPERDRLAAQETWRKGVAESGFTTRPLIRRSMLGALGALGLLALIPLRSLAKATSNQAAGEVARTHWFKGSRLIDTSTGQPVQLGTLAVGGLLTIVPEGVEHDIQAQADSVAMLIRMRPDELRAAPGRADFGYQGHVVYSKVCTHLGCPVSLYEQQTNVLLCPCHQSQFLATESARPIFGPAARPLPQLPIAVDAAGYFVALGDFPEPIGPSYWERT